MLSLLSILSVSSCPLGALSCRSRSALRQWRLPWLPRNIRMISSPLWGPPVQKRPAQTRFPAGSFARISSSAQRIRTSVEGAFSRAVRSQGSAASPNCARIAFANPAFVHSHDTTRNLPGLAIISACRFRETLFPQLNASPHINILMLAFAAQAQSDDCNASAASPSVTIALP